MSPPRRARRGFDCIALKGLMLARLAVPCLFLNSGRGFGGKPPKNRGFVGILRGSKMPKETFFTAISRWRATGFCYPRKE